MMTDFLTLIDPVELTEYARLAQADFDTQVQSAATLLPYKPVDDVKYAYDKGLAAFVDEAQYRAFDAESQIGSRPSGSRITGEILPISRKIPLSEYAQLRLRNASNEAMVNAVFEDGARLARGIAARSERARCQLLETGKVTIAENELVTEYNSGRAGGNTISTLGSTARWSAYTTATPISDVIGWSEVIRAAVGVSPTVMRISATVMGHLQKCDEVRGAFQPAASAPLRVPRGAVNDAFLELAGVRVEVVEPPAGMTTPPANAKKIVLAVDTIPLGGTLYGTPVEAFEPDYSQLGVQPGIVVGTFKGNDPVVPWTKAVALVLPILAIPDATLCAQVIA